MAYTKQTWIDGQSQVNAARLGKIEDGIAAAASVADSAASSAATATSTANTAKTAADNAAAAALTIGTTAGTAKSGDYVPSLADIPAGSMLVAPLDGSVNTSATMARPSSRTNIFFRWRSTVQPNNMISGDEWYAA